MGFESIKQGLNEAYAFIKGNKLKVHIHDINTVYVKNINTNKSTNAKNK
jgi:hypothetical protein